MTERTPRRRRVRGEVFVEMARLKGISDSVVAFALTLLVLDIRVPPDVLNDGLPQAIGQLGPAFAIYLLSFVLIGEAWGQHQRMLGQIERGDGLMVWWTLLSLLPITLVPACAVLLGDHATAPVAMTVFALDTVAIQATSALLWRHAGLHGLIDPDLDPRVVRSIGRRLWVVAGCFAVSIPIAFLWVPVAYLAWIVTFALVFATDWVSWQQSRRDARLQVGLEGAHRAQVRIAYGAGLLSIEPGDKPDVLVDGSFSGGVDHRTTRSAGAVDVRLALPKQSTIVSQRFPWAWGLVVDWQVDLTPAVPIDLEVELAGGVARLDLQGLQVKQLELVCPGSQADVTLPANAGEVTVNVDAKAAAVVLRVPDGVAARIHGGGAIETLAERFPRFGDGYRSPDFETATNRIDIRAELPSGSLTVAGPASTLET